MEELHDILFNLRTVHIKAQRKLSAIQFQRLYNCEDSTYIIDYTAANPFDDEESEVKVSNWTLENFQGYFKVQRQLNKYEKMKQSK